MKNTGNTIKSWSFLLYQKSRHIAIVKGDKKMDKDLMRRYEVLTEQCWERINKCKKALETEQSFYMQDYYKTIVFEKECELDALHFLVFGASAEGK